MLKRRFSKLVHAIVGESLSELEVEHASALLDAEREELATRVARFNQGLALHAGMCERLRVEIARLERELSDTERRLGQQLQVADRVGAGRSALRREQLQADLARQRAQHVEAESVYRELLASRADAISAARAKLDGLKRHIDDHALQSALADLSELASDLHGSISSSDLTIERLERGLAERRELSVGRLRVARDSAVNGPTMLRAEVVREEAEFALIRYEDAARPPTNDS